MISSSFSKTACTIGINMAVVAVLLIHMDRKAVTLMNPSINLKHGQSTLRIVVKTRLQLSMQSLRFMSLRYISHRSILDQTICEGGSDVRDSDGSVHGLVGN